MAGVFLNKDVTRRNLAIVARALNTAGIKWWLEAGTCLGFAREQDFIDHDKDIDIGIWPGEDPHKVVEAIEGTELSKIHIFGTPERGYEVSFKNEGVKVDVFFFYEDDYLWHAAWKHGEMIRLQFTKFGLREERFKGIKVFVPDPTELYLEERYGDWKTIKKDWDWAKDPLCIKQ
jgi:fukutin